MKQIVVIHGSGSTESLVQSGVSLLLRIYTDNMANFPLSEGNHSVLYADDLILFHTINSQDFQNIQCYISTIKNWVN